MAQYIPKSALVAELNKRLQERKSIKPSKEDDFGKGYLWGRDTEDEAVLYFIDTLEVKEMPTWEKVSKDTGQTTLYIDGGESYLERFRYRIDLKDLDKLPKRSLKAQKGEEV